MTKRVFDEELIQRIRNAFIGRAEYVERKMFGGVCFMVAGNMCCGASDDRLMARVGADQYEQALTLFGASKMDFTGRPLKGFIYVSAEAIADDQQLGEWLDRCLLFIATLPPKKIPCEF